MSEEYSWWGPFRSLAENPLLRQTVAHVVRGLTALLSDTTGRAGSSLLAGAGSLGRVGAMKVLETVARTGEFQRLVGTPSTTRVIQMLETGNPILVDVVAELMPSTASASAAFTEQFLNTAVVSMMVLDGVNPDTVSNWLDDFGFIGDGMEERREAITQAFRVQAEKKNPEAVSTLANFLKSFASQKRLQTEAGLLSVVQNSILAHLLLLAGKHTEADAREWLRKRGMDPAADAERIEDILKITAANAAKRNAQTASVLSSAVQDVLGAKATDLTAALRAGAQDAFIVQLMAFSGVHTADEAAEWLATHGMVPDGDDSARTQAVLQAFEAGRACCNVDADTAIWKAVKALAGDKGTQLADLTRAGALDTFLVQLMTLDGIHSEQDVEPWLITHKLAADQARTARLTEKFRKRNAPDADGLEHDAPLLEAVAAVAQRRRVALNTAAKQARTHAEAQVASALMRTAGVRSGIEAQKWLTEHGVTREHDQTAYDAVLDSFNTQTSAQEAQLLSKALNDALTQSITAVGKGLVGKGAAVYVGALLLQIAAFVARQRIQSHFDAQRREADVAARRRAFGNSLFGR